MWAVLEMIICANPALLFFYAGPAMADILYELGNDEQRALANAAIEKRWGATMVLTEPDAGSDVGAGRTKAIEQPDGSWAIHRRCQEIHLRRRSRRHGREHPAPGPRPSRRRAPWHQGPQPLRRAELSVRLGYLRDPRPQRCFRDPASRRAQDGLQGLPDVRVDVRRSRHPGQGLAGRRHPQRHRPDVQSHRKRPHARRHQIVRNIVDGLSQRAGLRQDAHPGRRHDADGRQECAASTDHPPPGRAAVVDHAEGLRRGIACHLSLHRGSSGSRCRRGSLRC